MNFFSLILKRLPWILLLFAIVLIVLLQNEIRIIPQRTETYQSLILDKVESIGKLELVKYNFQEITELKKLSAELDFKFFKLKNGPDSKAVLISRGEAAGCIDLTKISKNDILIQDDTLFIRLPDPELCYFKIDLQKSQIYDLDMGYLSDDDKKKFINELYMKAESELKNVALQTGIIQATLMNAELMLTPLFEEISDKKIQFVNRLQDPGTLEKY